MLMLAVYSRLVLMGVWLVVFVLLVFVGWRNERARPYIWALAPLALVNVVFYVASWLFRLGVWTPPTPAFFSELSNYRSWATAVTSLLILYPEARDLWTGRQS